MRRVCFYLATSDEKEDIGRSLVLSLRPCCGPMAPRLAAPSAPRLPIKLPIEMNEPLRLALACRGDHQTALHHMLMASPEDPRPFLCLLPSTMPHAVHPTILEHVVSAVDAQLMGIALVHEALR